MIEAGLRTVATAFDRPYKVGVDNGDQLIVKSRHQLSEPLVLLCPSRRRRRAAPQPQ